MSHQSYRPVHASTLEPNHRSGSLETALLRAHDGTWRRNTRSSRCGSHTCRFADRRRPGSWNGRRARRPSPKGKTCENHAPNGRGCAARMIQRCVNTARRSIGMISCTLEDNRTLNLQGEDMRKDDEAKAKDVLERVIRAVEALCVGKGDVRSRLMSAIYMLSPLRDRDFPTELQDQFRKIKKAATKYDASDLDRSLPLYPAGSWNERQGRIEATMRRIRRSTGKNIAQDIWSLYVRLRIIAKGTTW